MQDLMHTSRVDRRITGLRDLAVFTGFYFYIWLVVDTRLIQHCGGLVWNVPCFYRGWAFFSQNMGFPGGPIQYVTAFLAQLFAIGWLGAAVVTIHVVLLGFAAQWAVSAATGRTVGLLRPLPALLLLPVYGHYTYYFDTTTALLVVLLCVRPAIRAQNKNAVFSMLSFLLISIPLYYIAGPAYLIFALVCTLRAVFLKKRALTAPFYAATGPLIAYVVGVHVLNVSTVEAFSRLTPLDWRVHYSAQSSRMVEVVYLIYLLVPAIVLLDFIGRLWVRKDENKADLQPGKADTRYSRLAARSLALVAVAMVIAYSSHNRVTKTLLEVDYYSKRGMWDQVLEAGKAFPAHMYVVHAVDRALCHENRLAGEMFAYPQRQDCLFLTGDSSLAMQWRSFDIYLDLGLVNVAECMLVQAMEIFGEHPEIMKRLAIVNMAKGNEGAARVYLGAVAGTMFDSAWARRYISLLEQHRDLAEDETIARLRRLMPRNDREFNVFTSVMLKDLVDQGDENRMAFEYLLAIYLMGGEFTRTVDLLDRLGNFGFESPPPSCEEAVLLCRDMNPANAAAKAFKVSDETQERFNRFRNIYFIRYGKDKQSALHELAGDFGDTLMFYYVYGYSGVK